MQLLRVQSDANPARGSRSAAPTPEWTESVTTDNAHSLSAPAPVPVLVCMNAAGVHMRPVAPLHLPSLSLSYAACPPVEAGGRRQAYLGSTPTPSERLSTDGKPIGWQLHAISHIEVWGVKKTRPTFTYQVRERLLTTVELTGQSFKEVRVRQRGYASSWRTRSWLLFREPYLFCIPLFSARLL